MMGMRITVEEESMQTEGWVAMGGCGQGRGLAVPEVRCRGPRWLCSQKQGLCAGSWWWLVLLGMKNRDCSGLETVLLWLTVITWAKTSSFWELCFLPHIPSLELSTLAPCWNHLGALRKADAQAHARTVTSGSLDRGPGAGFGKTLLG